MPFANCIAVDLNRVWQPDVTADALQLPFKDESFDFVYCSHLVEHFSWGYAEKLLFEIYRVLDRFGNLFVTVPNLDWAIHNIKRGKEALKVIFGGQKDDTDFHKCGFNPESLRELLRVTGFEVEEMRLQYYQINAVCRK